MLKFTAKNLLPVVAEIQQYDAAMLLVKDEGIYVLSSEGESKDGRRTVAYAEGYDPAKFPDGGELYDACVDAVGGDDFAESLPLTDNVLTALAKGKHDLLIVVTETQIRIDLAPVGKVS
ncbi:MAG: DUF3085 domain-containing protein [Enterobacterales bacterium endosymbiont of Blomia tropicalis]|uniref:DUF3085 domain-containing protein n=1 Tax=Mixta mediterraneensis TaxID=2758443 RepID=UPI0025A7657C|nr:DUF3085 domain-containing protein [Mixta mediterraneensis]MDL4916264.1 DUF3085 domain-containing protein [Mixta mediterraneensis]